ncbi:MAG: Asp-tRNA(Asn)/Glu-tRNA(Gln) amidotransferase subunit GatB [bacterium]|nr:Asp-tRNA(Asn)/Glu-tRNA(Gln) amidotransferase subunit GatB [bacterium]
MYQLTIGLEIHVELKTKTKMFCGCLNDSDEKHPNINICPICVGHPGTLPTINKKAVEAVLKLGLALNSEIPKISKFDRKNYFYPDLPKGYQISQYDKPLTIGGELNGVKITRIHLEEDTARLVHSPAGKSSLVDFNRAGVPLMELVTEPDIKSGKEAVAFAKELQLILRYLDISRADMEKGQMRIEANISLREMRETDAKQDAKLRETDLGTKVEIKNLNSFRAVEEAVDYEIKRQAEVLESGKKVIHETRGWDEFEKKTKHQRLKEKSHDYRYFPEPDLPILSLRPSESEVEAVQNGAPRPFYQKGGVAAFDLEKLKAEIPELPAQKRRRILAEFILKPEQAEILVEDRSAAQYFEEAASELIAELRGTDAEKRGQEAINTLYNYLTSDIKGLMNEQKIAIKELNISPENFADLMVLIIKNEISSRSAKDILKEMFLTGLDPKQIIQEKGLKQISDEEVIKKAIQEVVDENPKAIEDYKKGKETALQFLIGQAMAKLKGQANPDILRQLFSDYLSK